MRANQINATLRRYNESVPEKYRTISVYSDSNSPVNAISSAFAKLIDVLAEQEDISTRTDVFIADSSISGKMLGNNYYDDQRFEYVEQRLILDQETLNFIKNSDCIVNIIKASNDIEDARNNLKKECGYNEDQISTIFRMRFDMVTISEQERLKNDIERMHTIVNERQPYKNND